MAVPSLCKLAVKGAEMFPNADSVLPFVVL